MGRGWTFFEDVDGATDFYLERMISMVALT